MKIPKNIPKIKKAPEDQSSIFLKKWEKVWQAIHPDIEIHSNESENFSQLLRVTYNGLQDQYSQPIRIVSYKNKHYCFLEGDTSYATDDKYTPEDDFFIGNNLETLKMEYTWENIRDRIIEDIENSYLEVPQPSQKPSA